MLLIKKLQQVADFSDSITFQKKLRSVWQHQQEVTYCMFGSKKHLMENIFNERSMPFYKFGDMMFLKKIPKEEWIPFISNKFRETGKTISEEQITKICELTENLSSYVQHLVWLESSANIQSVKKSLLKRGIIDIDEQAVTFDDSIFKLWMQCLILI